MDCERLVEEREQIEEFRRPREEDEEAVMARFFVWGGWSRIRKIYEMWKNRRRMIRKMEEEAEGTG